MFVFSRFLRNRIYALSSIVWWARAHQNAEYSCAEKHLKWIFPLNFYEEERTRRRNGGIILSLARSKRLRETFKSERSSAHEIRLYYTHGVHIRVSATQVHTYVRVQIRGRQVARISRRASRISWEWRLTTRAAWRRVGAAAPETPGGPGNPPMCASRTNYNILDGHRLPCARVLPTWTPTRTLGKGEILSESSRIKNIGITYTF